ncbi:insulin-like peptide receptor [Condylostylus longicornis]|uniref:insulin-like peptide receptor n=1 Tax=Condylostylus longicornis TaxID=2530218 RepID=UPI00244E2D2C|nr:insulin-like peptide receptor [Condylostylus longicornis]
MTNSIIMKMKNFSTDLLNFMIIFLLLIASSIANNSFHYNCTSTIIDYSINSLDLIKNCTVIHGSLTINRIDMSAIGNIENNNNKNNINNYTILNLREITEYLIIYNITGLTSLAALFPNLAIIRGKTVFHNYALSIYENPDLEEIGLKSLLSISRGHVFIDHCPKLCNADQVYWTRLTLSTGNNYIQSTNATNCPVCHGCSYCWGEKYCQFYEGYDLFNQKKNLKCHPQCFGGCSQDSSDMHCYVCKNYNENSRCVERCTENSYAYDLDMHCYTKEECINQKGGLLYESSLGNECVLTCPYGFMVNESTCVECTDVNDPDCYIQCDIDVEDSEVDSLARIEQHKGCHVLNNSLNIRLLDNLDASELENNFGEIRIIRGHLRVYNSPYIKNLKFLKNLQEVHGIPTKNKNFGILIYQNNNLTQLWDLHQIRKIKLIEGGLYIDSNPKLCNWEIQTMQKSIEHNRDLDFIVYNDEEIFCDKGSFELEITDKSSKSLTLTWRTPVLKSKFQYIPSKIIEIFFREYSENISLTLDHDLDKDICLRTSWTKIQLKNYRRNNYTLTNLHENTRYVFIVKLYNSNNKIASVQSTTTYASTTPDFTIQPKIFTTVKMYNLIGIGWKLLPYQFKILTKIIIEVYKITDNQYELDTRDFCKTLPEYYSKYPPAFEKGVNGNEIKCLYGKTVEENEDDEFDTIIRNKFQYSNYKSDNYKNYSNASSNILAKNISFLKENFIRNISIVPTQNNFQAIKNLTHATLYMFKVFFCTRIGCNDYRLHFDKTYRINDGNAITNTTIIESGKYENGTKKYSLQILEPNKPNGAILSYKVLFQKFISSENHRQGGIETRNKTMIRLFCYRNIEMQKNNFTIDYDKTFNFAISVLSTYDDGKFSPLKGFQESNKNNVITEEKQPTFLISPNSSTDNNNNNKIENNDSVGSNSVITIEILVIILIILIVGGVSWYTYKKYPNIKTKIYYNVHDDRIDLLGEDYNNPDDIDEEIQKEMETIQLQNDHFSL